MSVLPPSRRRFDPEKLFGRRFVSPPAFPGEFITALVWLLLSILLFLALVYVVLLQKQDIIDTNSFLFIKPLVSPLHTRMAVAVTFLGTGSFLIPGYVLIVIYLVKANARKQAVMVAATAVSSVLLGWLLKDIFHRPRPPMPLVAGAGGYSFPSGHALGGFIFSGVLLLFVQQLPISNSLKRILFLPIAFFGLLVAASRVYLHVHYASDVLGSLLVTLVWFSLLNIYARLAYKTGGLPESKPGDAAAETMPDTVQWNNLNAAQSNWLE